MEMIFLRAILNNTKKDRIRNTDIRLELGVDGMKNDIPNSRLRQFGYLMPMRQDRILNKMLHKIEEKRYGIRARTRWIDQIRKDIEIGGENWKEVQENRKWENRDGWRFLCYSRPIHLGTT